MVFRIPAVLLMAALGTATNLPPAGAQSFGGGEEMVRATQIRIQITSILVEDQDSALRFYTEVLGFEKKEDIPVGEYQWLTVTSPAGVDGVELLLEPNAHPAAAAFQKSIYEDGISATVFFVTDLQAEYERLKGLGVEFKSEPVQVGEGWQAVFDDTCGNFITLYQK